MTGRIGRMMAAGLVIGLIGTGGIAGAETTAPTIPQSPAVQAEPDYSSAQFVHITLGTNLSAQGLRLLEDQPDGLTRATAEGSARQALSNASASERYFYFDAHNSYVSGGHNQIEVALFYKDTGLTPIYLEYDSYDPVRPQSTSLEVTRKRILLVQRTDSEDRKYLRVTLEDARFADHLPGGADFRIGSADDLILFNVSVRVLARLNPLPSPRVTIDGKEVPFDPDDAQPFIDPDTSRTLVPLRAMANALGISDSDIAWDNETRTVSLVKGQTTIQLTIDSKQATVNGLSVPELDQPAVIHASRTFVPARFVADQFGLTVDWDAEARIVVLLSNAVEIPETPEVPQPSDEAPQPSNEVPAWLALPPVLPPPTEPPPPEEPGTIFGPPQP